MPESAEPPPASCAEQHRRVGNHGIRGSGRFGGEIRALRAARADEDAAQAEARRMAQLVTDLRVENDALFLKLARVSQAIRVLAGDLANSRRECRRKHLELESLRALLASSSVAPDSNVTVDSAACPPRGSADTRGPTGPSNRRVAGSGPRTVGGRP
jgi:hypothetical protein